MEPSDYQREQGEGYRAIGRYIVSFSELVSEMRNLVAQHIGGEEKWVLAQMALGEANAMTVANAFFGLCRDAAQFTPVEERVAVAVSNEVNEAIATRNDIAHGDWSVGDLKLGDAGTYEVMPPRVIRIVPHRKAGPYKMVELAIADLDALSAHLVDLIATVVEFGRLALGMPLYRTFADGTSAVRKGGLRVGDVYAVAGGKGNTHATLTRDGPQAATLTRVIYSG
jgi:hypothetical protein